MFGSNRTWLKYCSVSASQSCWVTRLHFAKLTSLFPSLWDLLMVSLLFIFLSQVRGCLINHHFKVARLICIQIRGAAPRTAGIGAGIPRSSGSSCSAPQKWLILGLSFLLTWWTLSQRKMPQPPERLLLLIFRSLKAPSWWNTASLVFAVQVPAEERLLMWDLFFVDFSGGSRGFLLELDVPEQGRNATPAESSGPRAAKDCKT